MSRHELLLAHAALFRGVAPSVSRIVGRWERLGVVRTARERVVLRDPHGPVAIADDVPASVPDVRGC